MCGRVAKRILFVDNDKNMRRLGLDILTVTGYFVDVASDGIEALERLKASDYDLVITDINMPRLDGLGLYEDAVREHPYLKDSFVFITANLTREIWSVIRKTGQKCLVKPFRITDLLECVDRLIFGHPEQASQEAGLCKRQEERYGACGECELIDRELNDKRPVLVKVQDVSRHGLRISFADGVLRPGAEMGVYIGLDRFGVVRNAKVVWSKKADGQEAVAGLLFAKPVPIASMSRETRLRDAGAC